MQGLMQDWSLTVDRILDHGAIWHGQRDVVSRPIDGGELERTTYRDIRIRAKRLSNALYTHGIRQGDRVATLAFNTHRHVEVWYGVMGIGAVCHTLNPRLFPEQLVYIINHAQDRLIFADPCMASLVTALLPRCPTIEAVIWLSSDDRVPPQPHGRDYETFIAGHADDCVWGDFPESTAAGLCYTSGTTGHPKGVLYSHRSNYLHTLMTLQADVLGLRSADNVLMLVPMFHANAWGLAFSATAVGAKLVMPGNQLNGAAILDLLVREEITFAGGVPTVFQMLMQELERTGADLPHLRRVVIGGAACPETLIRTFQTRYDVEVTHLWGMTELSPIGSVGQPCARVAALPYEEQIAFRVKQGRVPLGVDLALTDDADRPVPHDGVAIGQLKVRGHSVARAYFRGEGGDVLDADGFFDTGDVATISPEGYIQITDRAKDVIKSGGEWISSIEIENIASGRPGVALAAVIGLPHPKWDERPLLVVEMKSGEIATRDDMLSYLEGKIARWWMPDDVIFAPVPLGATGKIDKK